MNFLNLNTMNTSQFPDQQLLDEVYNGRQIIKDRFINKTLENQGMQAELLKTYKPLLESEAKTRELMTDLSEKSRELKIDDLKEIQEKTAAILEKIHATPNLGELINLIDKYPNIQRAILGEHVELNALEEGIINEISTLSQNQQDIIIEYSRLKLEGVEETEEIDKSKSEEMFNGEEIYDLFETEKNVEMNDRDKENLRNYLIGNSAISLNKNRKVIKNIMSSLGPDFIDNIKKRRAKMGSGIEFLPSDSQTLMNKLNILIGSYTVGNTDVFNEIGAITDELRRQGVLSISKIKSIYKHMNK